MEKAQQREHATGASIVESALGRSGDSTRGLVVDDTAIEEMYGPFRHTRVARVVCGHANRHANRGPSSCNSPSRSMTA